MRHRQTGASYGPPLPGGDVIGWVVGEGDVAGERISGTLRRSNLPYHRPDGEELPSSAGVITTADGAEVFYEFHGLTGRGAMTFRAADERYAWLGRVFAVAERVGTSTAPVRYEVYECVPDRST
jgi:hypothetical protein